MKLFIVMSMLALGVCVASAAEKPRVFVTDSKSWEIAGSSGGSGGTFGGNVHGGARPQTAEIIKTFGERCPDVIPNNKQEKADYIVLLDHEGGKGWARKDNKVAVFNWDGDSILSHSTRSLGNSVKDACDAITRHWAEKGSSRAKPAPEQTVSATSARAVPAPEFTKTKVSISSQPVGADIEVDGAFVGNTPSSVELSPGEHRIVVTKSGHKAWERKIHTSGGDVNLVADLEKS